MACPIPTPPPFVKALGALPSGAHAYAQAYLDRCLAQGAPMGSYERGTLQGVRVVSWFTRHVVCNGVPGCCPAVTLFADTAPPGVDDSGVTPLQINWPVVAATGVAAGVVIAGFVLMLRHTGRRHRRR